MLIHSFLTNGEPMFQFALLFLESFKYFNEEDYKIVLTGKDLSKDQIEQLRATYANLDIYNSSIDYSWLSGITGYSIEELKKIKEKVEKRKKNISTKEDLTWKQYISVDERYKNSIIDTINLYKNEYNHMIHFDIDTCFYGNIEPLEHIVKENDISFKWRYGKNNKKEKPIKKRIAGYCIGITINEQSKKFVNKWIDYINKVPLMERENGYGQEILYLAWKDLNSTVKIGEFPMWTTEGNVNRIGQKEKPPIIIGANHGSKPKNITKMKELLWGKSEDEKH